MTPKGFRCIHCGSRESPTLFIDSNLSENRNILYLLGLLTLLSCCMCFPVVFLYPLMAYRSHRCSECGIRLGS